MSLFSFIKSGSPTFLQVIIRNYSKPVVAGNYSKVSKYNFSKFISIQQLLVQRRKSWEN